MIPATYPSTLTNLTLIILFSEKISKIIFSKSKNIVKDNSEYLFSEMKNSKLINYSTDMC
jgi:hypothetical protein